MCDDEDVISSIIPADILANSQVPLIVDLDGSLVKSDLMVEGALSMLTKGVRESFSLFSVFAQSKSAFKERVAKCATIDATLLPYNRSVLDLMSRALADGRKVYLATASHRIHADAVAKHLPGIEGVYATEHGINLSGSAKAKALITHFGEGGFDYVGNSRTDVAIWAVSAQRFVVGARSAELKRAFKDLNLVNIDKPQPRFADSFKIWLRVVRAHQWVKNSLVFVPLLVSHDFTLPNEVDATLAFMAFCLCASASYIINDLLDLQSDRQHRSKCKRPIASGEVGILDAVQVGLTLLIASLVIGLLVSPAFAGIVLLYLALTLSYTFFLKQKLFVDVIALAILYSIRVAAGAVAVNVAISEWLLCFSLFTFTSLALIKRYVDLTYRAEAGALQNSRRGYETRDIPVVGGLAMATSMNAVLVFALYLSSIDVKHHYRHPLALFMICPLLLFFFGRAMFLAHRLHMADDPIVFAFKDWPSRLVALCCLVLITIAI